MTGGTEWGRSWALHGAPVSSSVHGASCWVVWAVGSFQGEPESRPVCSHTLHQDPQGFPGPPPQLYTCSCVIHLLHTHGTFYHKSVTSYLQPLNPSLHRLCSYHPSPHQPPVKQQSCSLPKLPVPWQPTLPTPSSHSHVCWSAKVESLPSPLPPSRPPWCLCPLGDIRGPLHFTDEDSIWA